MEINARTHAAMAWGPTPRGRQWRPVVALGMLTAVLALQGCGDSQATPSAEAPASAAPTAANGRLNVAAASLRMLDIQAVGGPSDGTTVWAPARVDFLDGRVDAVGVPVAARVLQVQVQVGDTVQAGAPLATLVSSEALRVRYEVEAARSAQDTAQAEFQRQQTMLDKGVGVATEHRAAQARLREATQELNRATGTAALLGAGSGDRIVVRAPRSGVVAERHAMPGTQAESGAVLFTIGDPRAMGVVAEVFESELAGLRVGATAKVELPQHDKPVEATVRHIGAVVDKESRRAQVLLSLNSAVDGLRAGMQARAALQLPARDQLLVPMSAVLIKDQSHSVVYVQTGEHEFEARAVELGQPVRGQVPVVSGLKPGEKIVVRGGLLLDGAASQLI